MVTTSLDYSDCFRDGYVTQAIPELESALVTSAGIIKKKKKTDILVLALAAHILKLEPYRED